MNRAIADLPPLTGRDHTLQTSADRLGWLEDVPKAERQSRTALWARLERDGYLLLRGAISPAASVEFRRYYFAHLKASGLLEAGSDPALGIASQLEYDRAALRRALFEEIVPGAVYAEFCDALSGFFQWLFAASVHLHQRKLIRHALVNDTWITPAHYDLVYLREGSSNLLSAWIPLGDCPVERGGLIYLEGSHRHFAARDVLEGGAKRAEHISYDLPALAEELDTRWLIADYRAGDVVVHSPYLLHASLNNVDANRQMRLSTDIRFQSSNETIDPRWQQHWRDDDGL